MIRDAQIEAFQREERARFADRMVRFVAAEYPEEYQALEAAGTRRFAERAIDFGLAHGIRAEGGLLALAGLMIQYGESFERSPDRGFAQGILDHATLPGQLKIEILLERMASRTQGRVVVMQGDD